MSWRRWIAPAAFVLGLLMLVLGGPGLALQRSDVEVSNRLQPTSHGSMPVAVYQLRGEGGKMAPAVIVVHGFAANKEMMRPFGYYLARLGYRAYLVDVSGHGQNPSLLDRQGAPADITALIDDLVAAGEVEPGRIALVGHSMGTYIATEAARDDARVAATVVFSTITDDVQPGHPKNYLMLTAKRDLANVKKAFENVMAPQLRAPYQVPSGTAVALKADVSQGAAVEGLWVPGRNHITILYDGGALEAMGLWIGKAFGQTPGAVPDAWKAIGLGWAAALVTGALLTFTAIAIWLSRWFRRYALQGQSAPYPYLWPFLYLIAGLAAMGAASLFHPLSFLRLMVSDYVGFFLLVTALALEAMRRAFKLTLIQQAHANLDLRQGWPSLLYGGVLSLLFVGLLAPVLTYTLTNALPAPERLWRAAFLVLVLAPFFLIDENIKAAVQSQHGGWIAFGLAFLGKLVIAGTWVLSTRLPHGAGFLVIAMPVLLPVFGLMDALTTMIFAWRRESMSLGLFKAIVFAWLLATAFPLGTGF